MGRFDEPSESLQWRLHIPYPEDGLRQLDPPRSNSARRTVAPEDAAVPCFPGPEKLFLKLHVDWGPVSAEQLRSVIVERGGRTMGLMNFAYRVLRQREACRAFDTAPHLPIAGTSTASSFHEELQVDFLFVDDAIPLRAIDMFPKCPPLARARSGNPVGGRGASCSSRIAI